MAILTPLALEQQQANLNKVLDNQKLNGLKQKFGVDLEPVTIYHSYEEGTRTTVLSNIDQWASKVDSCPLLWITGPPGIGKSTLIEAFIQKEPKDANYIVGAYYSFSGKQDKGQYDLLGSMIVKLVERFRLRKELDEIHEKLANMLSNQSISSKDLEEIFISVLRGVIEYHPNKPVVLGIDALDECKKEDSDLSTFDVISNIMSDKSAPIKLIICSRYGVQVDKFESLKEEGLLEHTDLERESNEGLKEYIRRRAQWIQQSNPKKFSNIDWLSNDQVTDMAEKAGGLFIWVKTAFGRFQI